MKPFIAFCLLMSVMYFSFAEDAPKVAVASIIRGDVDLLIMGKTTKLKKDDWVKEGSVVKTADKSFVKLIFIDKSQMNIGPNSEMKIAKFSGNESGIIDLVKGKIRSQVTKDYLQMKDKDKSKLFIKTPNAVMGIRGTDFLITFNAFENDKKNPGQGNSSVVLFEGDVSFNKMDAKNVNDTNKLEDIVNEGVRVAPGEFTVVDPAHTRPTVPAVLNVQQREALQNNETFDQRAPSNAAADDSKKSIVPVGLTSIAVSAKSETLKNEMGQAAGASEDGSKTIDSKAVNGYVKGDEIKPADGSVLHETGAIIAPDAGSSLDANTGTYSVSSNVTIGSDGSVSIKGAEINSDGQLMKTVMGSDGKLQVVVTPMPSPVKSNDPLASNLNIGPGPAHPPLTGLQKNPDITLNPNGSGPMNNSPSGGIMNVNDAVQQFNQKAKTIINVNN